MRLLTLDVIISNEIKYMIDHQPILEGEKLPGERELAALLDVQRATVRKGLKILLNEGWIYAKNRSGYFVSPKRIKKNVYFLDSTSKSIQTEGTEMKLTLVKCETIEVGKELSPRIKLPLGTKLFFICRLRTVKNEHVSLEISYIPVEQAPTLLEKDLEKKALYEILEQEYLVDLDHSTQTITTEKANSQVADLLDIEEGTSLLREDGLVSNREGESVEYSISYMKMDRFEYTNINC